MVGMRGRGPGRPWRRESLSSQQEEGLSRAKNTEGR